MQQSLFEKTIPLITRLLVLSGIFWAIIGIYLEVTPAVIGGGLACLGYVVCIYLYKIGYLKISRLLLFVVADAAIIYGTFNVPNGGFILLMLLGLVPLLFIFFDWKSEKPFIAAIALINSSSFIYFVLFYPLILFEFYAENALIHSLIVLSVCFTILLVTGTSIGFAVIENDEKTKLLIQSQNELQKAKQELEWLAFHDDLTGIYSRRWLKSRFGDGNRTKDAVFYMIDLDDFKSVNDQHGHDVGDLLLKRIAEVLSKKTKKIGCALRLGGEEFAVIRPWKNWSEAKTFGEELLKEIASVVILHNDAEIRRTASIGIAKLEKTASISDTMRSADKSLYKAKQDGRNNLSLAED